MSNPHQQGMKQVQAGSEPYESNVHREKKGSNG